MSHVTVRVLGILRPDTRRLGERRRRSEPFSLRAAPGGAVDLVLEGDSVQGTEVPLGPAVRAANLDEWGYPDGSGPPPTLPDLDVDAVLLGGLGARAALLPRGGRGGSVRALVGGGREAVEFTQHAGHEQGVREAATGAAAVLLAHVGVVQNRKHDGLPFGPLARSPGLGHIAPGVTNEHPRVTSLGRGLRARRGQMQSPKTTEPLAP